MPSEVTVGSGEPLRIRILSVCEWLERFVHLAPTIREAAVGGTPSPGNLHSGALSGIEAIS